MSSRREILSNIELNIEARPNAGLWLDKYIRNLSRDDKESHSRLAREVASIRPVKNYEQFCAAWKADLENLGAICRTAKVTNRMAVGLGSNGVLETSVMLHRTYGVPFIPGSALKGLAAAFARQYCGDDWQRNAQSGYYKVVFGTNDEAGYVTFFDALYFPNPGHDANPLHFDVMTVHHRGYYEGKNQPPADWDDPNPVPFISATGEYLIALGAPEGCEPWRDVALKILEEALEHEGVGAKTSSGYGRMKLEPPPPDPDQQKVETMLRVITAIPPDKLPSELSQQAGVLLKSDLSPQHKRQVAELIIKRVNDAGKQRKKFAEKPWFAELERIVKETA